jgi:dimethylaniline monooxygenase (N-oxide forming)
MPIPQNHKESGGRLTGEDMQNYFELFAERFLQRRILFDTLIENISYANGGWDLKAVDLQTKKHSILHFDKIVLCSGVG